MTHSQEEALALADLIIVMTNARIEQAGAPRDIFNAPRTEFVARFIGGHNIVAEKTRKVAIRADRLRLERVNGAAAAFPATVSGVEYQGAVVNVTLATAADGELTATLPEAEFYANPFNAGDEVALNWADADEHELAG